MKFTQATVARLKMPEGKLEHIEFDDSMPGFGLRVRNGGKREHRTYILQYKIGPKQRRMSLGNVSKLDLATAQRKARQPFCKSTGNHFTGWLWQASVERPSPHSCA